LALTICKGRLRFYRDGLGLKTEGIVGTEFEYGAVAFFDLQAGLKLALWRERVLPTIRGSLLADPTRPISPSGTNVSSKVEVDAVMEQAKRAGASRRKAGAGHLLGWLRGLLPRP